MQNVICILLGSSVSIINSRPKRRENDNNKVIGSLRKLGKLWEYE